MLGYGVAGKGWKFGLEFVGNISGMVGISVEMLHYQEVKTYILGNKVL
ncbi:hypothetical protein [Dyadobacter aurulentus]|nr:hypothetical protein [Dyadobacter sp. UC 10]